MSTVTAKHILILAKSHRDAVNFTRGKGLHPSNWTYINQPDSILGWGRNIHFIETPQAIRKKNYRSIREACLRSGLIEAVDVKVENKNL